jgi:hypothetical protein
MNNRTIALLASAAVTFVAGSAFAQSAPPAPAPAPAAAAPAAPAAPSLLGPAMSGSLSANGSPTAFDAGILGSKVYVTGALTGLAITEDHPVPGDFSNQADIANAQVFINKSDGVVQYYLQAGAYSLPALGVPYAKSGVNTNGTFGYVPEAFIKLAPDGTPFSIEGGKLPTLIGDEYNFTFQNLNIERGLLWGIEPAISKGVQVNYSQGPVSGSFAFTDGFDSDQYNSVSGLLTWTIDPADTVAVAGEGSLNKTTRSTVLAPAYLQNEQIYNVIYTHTMGPWTLNPYFQYTSTPKVISLGIPSFNTQGYALLGNYVFDSKSSLAGVSLPLRVEYMTSSNSTLVAKEQYSVTFTPTYQYKVFFVRGEVSYISASTPLFGSSFAEKTQTRGLIETGVLF